MKAHIFSRELGWSAMVPNHWTCYTVNKQQFSVLLCIIVIFLLSCSALSVMWLL